MEGALEVLSGFAAAEDLTLRIGDLERMLSAKTTEEAKKLLNVERIDSSVLEAALAVKRVAGQINVIVHAIGILVSLPYVLDPEERIESLSLGAGNTGRMHDLETDRQIAEFKFIEWRGGPESIRQNSLFIDFFNLVSARTRKRRVLYVVGKAAPLRFLNNRRAIASVLSKNAAVAERFRSLYGKRFTTVREFYATVEDEVDIVDLAEIVPALQTNKG
jgi:hypothetical protein